jgi:hypothetical protein
MSTLAVKEDSDPPFKTKEIDGTFRQGYHILSEFLVTFGHKRGISAFQQEQF